jgi:glycosyltransferase involved in cell wall biosynthesis
VVTNEPVRRGRVTGTDLLGAFTEVAPVDVFGIGVAGLAGPRITAYEDPDQPMMHAALAQRRLYLHLPRWTSLGLSLIEAMHMGCPVVAVGTTEAALVVPPEAGAVSADVDVLVRAARQLIGDPAAAVRAGAAARTAAQRFGLSRFLADWEELLRDVAHAHTGVAA